ncbi:mas-related G-protein coupled receptor member H-like [Sceloporus undulatus]|uniref:mas-related G-protein coupled receptor member H-like n=1 Tax=Sceloporus undulatus TaxID=8520 RepID=UPI001C4CE34B|nr:mas-related G-protein coupled receptor member H-like [Sceloporus undulatus]
MAEDTQNFTGINDVTGLLELESNMSDYGNNSFNFNMSQRPYPGINGSTGIGHPINGTNYLLFESITKIIINSFVLIICLLGLLGNGMVIWLLGFRMKRNPFTTYILNLSIADFGVLIFLIIVDALVMLVDQYHGINIFSLFFLIFLELFFFTYSTSQFLLAAISIDRCLAILFPLWHRCHRPSYLSIVVCTLIWIVSFLLSGIHFTLLRIQNFGNSPFLYPLIVNVALCAPIMVASTLILVIHIWCKAEQRHRGKLVTAILLALLFFLIFALPLNVFYIIHQYHTSLSSIMSTGFACASLNSSINPLIYFLVGKRQKKGQSRVSMKVALQRVFKNEHEHTEEQNTTSETDI